jgi:rhodanese-related sulfurtransferase
MNNLTKWIVIGVVAVLAGFMLFGQDSKPRKTISVEEAHAMLAKDSTIVVLDVRTPEEYTGSLGHIEASVLIPVQELKSRVGELEKYKGKTIFAVCRTGNRSGKACDLLSKQGFAVVNVDGGMTKWNEKNFPVAK